MVEFLEAVVGVEAAFSIIVVLVLLELSLKSRTELTSERVKERLKEKKIRFFVAIFLGVVAAAMFVVIELFEAGEALSLVYSFVVVESLLEAVQLVFMLAAQILILSLVLEVRRHGR